MKGDGPSLFGRDWFHKIKLDWDKICAVTKQTKAQEILEKFTEFFSEGLGQMNTITASLTLKEGAKPQFCRARPVPFALKEAIEQELDNLEEADIIEKAPHSNWAAPIVLVPKPNGRIRLCGDFKVTINLNIDIYQYPLPKTDHLFASLAGGKHFTKIDLTNTYQQVPLDPQSRELVTVNTHKGLYRYD